MPANITIIGAGIVGIACASYLRRDGHEVTVVDALPPGEYCSFGNAGILTGPDGVFLVDAQYAQLTDKLVAAIKAASNGGQVRFLVNTHHHLYQTLTRAVPGARSTIKCPRRRIRERACFSNMPSFSALRSRMVFKPWAQASGAGSGGWMSPWG